MRLLFSHQNKCQDQKMQDDKDNTNSDTVHMLVVYEILQYCTVLPFNIPVICFNI